MQESKVWKMLLNHLDGEESEEEKEVFLTWLNKSNANKLFFDKLKDLWCNKNNTAEYLQKSFNQTFFKRFTKKKIKDFILKQAIGNLIGFTVGLWVTAMFSHDVLERRRLKNLFGLNGRKKIVVNDIPEWLQNGIAILIGFIALELVNHFFQTKKYLVVWEYIKVKLHYKRNSIN